MSATALQLGGLREAAENAARGLLSVRHWGDSTFVGLPLLYPDSSFVTVKIDPMRSGFRVSDNGFAYRQAECFWAQRSFAKTAGTIAEEEDVLVGKREIYLDVPEQELSRAICDVAKVSWLTADRIIGRASLEAAVELEAHLHERLLCVFGEERVDEKAVFEGATNEWDVSAIVVNDGRKTIFQAIANHPNSIFKASTAFSDIAQLPAPPLLIGVVHRKAALGKRLALITRDASVIEEDQSDEVFARAAEWHA